MNSVKKRKIAAFVTLSVMLVAVVAAACILTAPSLYKDEGITPTNTAAYGMDNVTLNSSNTAVAMSSFNNHEGDARIMFPTSIYMDRSENLSDIGYYFFGDYFWGSNDEVWWWTYHSVFGSYEVDDISVANIAQNSDENRMNQVFNGYYVSAGDKKFVQDIQTGTEGPNSQLSGNKFVNKYTKVRPDKNKNALVKYNMYGTVKSDIANGTYVFSSPDNNVGLFYEYWKSWISSGNKGDTFRFDQGATVGDQPINHTMDDGTGINIPAYYSYANKVTININIYDKSQLNTAINNFQNKIDSNKSLLNKLNGNSDEAYNRANTFISNIRDNYLKKREVTQTDIDNQVKAINNYIIELDKPAENAVTGKEVIYNGSEIDISQNILPRYDSRYFDLQFEGSGSGSYSEIKNVGSYSIKISPKIAEVDGLKFKWFGGNYDYLNCGAFEVKPRVFSVTGVQNRTMKFKNSDYEIQLGDVQYENFVDAEGTNVKTVEVSLDGTTWSSSVFLGASAEDIKKEDGSGKIIRYRVSAANHETSTGTFVVYIEKADIKIAVSSFEQVYGSNILTSDEILEKMINYDNTPVLDAANDGDKKEYLRQIIREFVVGSVNSPIINDGTNYANVGKYSIDFRRNGDWNDRIGEITFLDGQNRESYTIVPRPVKVEWTQKTNLWYDNKGGKRPSAEIVSEDGDFAPGTTTGLNDVTIAGKGQNSAGDTVNLVNGEAIYAGTYKAEVTCTNSNYVVDPTSMNCNFTILPRKIKVELKDRVREYAYSTTADQVWKNYIEKLFPANSNESIYSLSLSPEVTDGKPAVAEDDSVLDIFTIVLRNAKYTADNNYFLVTETGQEYVLALDLLNSNYEFSADSKDAKFIVTPAKIQLSLQSVASKIYKGVDQEIVMTNNNNVIELRGYEATNRESVKVEYCDTEFGTYTSNPLTIKNVGTKVVYYKITAPNHITELGHFTAEVAQTTIYVDVKGQKTTVTYGDELPDSDGLIDLLDIECYWSTDPQVNESLKFDLSDKIEFHLLDGTGSAGIITTRRQAQVGSHTVSHGFINGETSDNCNIVYVTRKEGDKDIHKNVGAFKVSQKTIYVDWKQVGDKWSEDGMKYTYNQEAPKVSPIAPYEYDGKENVVFDGETDKDVVTLEIIQLGGNRVGSYTVTTSLRTDRNIRNYKLANAEATFEITPLEISVKIKNQTATYGNARTIRFDTALIAPDLPGAMWAYADGSARFFSGHFANYRLVSEAHSAPEGSYKDVGDYDINMIPVENATGEIVDNYKITIVKADDMQAKFTITPADIHFMGRQFNIDLENKDGVKEDGFVRKSQVEERISTSTNTPLGEFNVEMSDLFQGDMEIEGVTDWVEEQTSEKTAENVGSYYIWVRITHKNAAEKSNFKEFTAKLEVNIWTDWVSVTISKGIEDAEYGSTPHTSDELFDGLTFSSITGIVDGSGANKPLADALEELKNYVRLFVGSGDTTTPMTGKNDYGKYSIYFDIIDKSEGAKYKHFRFLPYGDNTHTSNIDAYTVVQRTVGIIWGDAGNMNEVYGEHSSGGIGVTPSNSHKYQLTNVLEEDKDNVSVTIEFSVKEEDGNTGKMEAGHVRDVGTYIARVTRISHPNYKLPAEALECEFEITARPISISIADREITYGANEATRGGINNFLNASASGITLYDVTSGSIFKGDTVANIFKLKIGAYDLASGLNYLTANENNADIEYLIEIEKLLGSGMLGHNYNITVDKNGLLTVNNAQMTFDRAQIQSKRYNGQNQSVAPDYVYYTLQGDGDALKDQAKVSYRLHGEGAYTESLEVKDAQTYQIDIKIEAPNHEVFETTSPINFTVEKINVEITMTQATKTYGDTESDLLADAGVSSFSDWLKKMCQIKVQPYYLDSDGKRVNCEVAGLDGDFEFKVIKKGQGNGDALEVGKNDVGTYRVYHVVQGHNLDVNYVIDYYQDPDLAEGDEHKCNYDAYKIIKREVAVEWVTQGAIENDNKFEYSGAAPDIKAYVELVGETDKKEVPVMSEMLNAKDKEKALIDFNVGVYSAKVVGDDSFEIDKYMSNYEFVNNNFRYEIVAKKVNVTILNQTAVYGDDLTKTDSLLDGTKYTSDVELIKQPIELKRHSDALGRKYYGVGEYRIYGTCLSDNYDVTFRGENSNEEYGIFKVTEAKIELSAHTHVTNYNGRDLELDVKESLKHETNPDGSNVYKLQGDMNWDDVNILYKQENGEYTATKPVIKGITDADGVAVFFKVEVDNHITEIFSVTVRVNPAKLVINIVKGGASSVYGDDLLSSDDIFKKAKITLDAQQSSLTDVDLNSILNFKVETGNGAVHAHTYNIGYEFKDSADAKLYNIELVGATDAYEITKREVTIKWSYTQPFVYNKAEHNVTAEVVGAVNGDTVTANYRGNVGIDAGEYTAEAISIDNGDYKLGESAKLTWVIAPKGIAVVWNNGDFTYDGNEHIVDVPSIAEGLISGDTCDIAVGGAQKNAGKHIATAEALNGNYTVVNNTFEFEIKQASIDVVWESGEFVYNGKDQVPTAKVDTDALIAGDTCDVIVEGAQKNAGNDYTATATLGNGNYKINANATYKFSIAPKAITFDWTEKDGLKFNDELQAPKAVAVGIVEGDSVELIVEGAQKNAGSGYIATVTGVKDNANYVIDTLKQTEMSITFSIAKGVNSFDGELTLPSTVDKMPWIGTDKPTSKWGEVIVKYYLDEACTQEVTDIENAGEGIYWVKAIVVGTDNYEELVSEAFKIELQGGLNVAIVVIGAIASIALLAGAVAVVMITDKKKKQQGDAV